MKQKEMSIYLKFITLGVSVFLLAFVVWFVPMIIKDNLTAAGGKAAYLTVCIFILITSVPCFMCLAHFWKICGRIGSDRSFTKENAISLKRMSQLMILDTILYVLFLVWYCFVDWAKPLVGLLFALLLAVFVCVTLAVVCVALSHLVHKASEIQEEQDLTI